MRPSAGQPLKGRPSVVGGRDKEERALGGCLDLLLAFRISRNFHLILQSGDLIEFLHFDSYYHF